MRTRIVQPACWRMIVLFCVGATWALGQAIDPPVAQPMEQPVAPPIPLPLVNQPSPPSPANTAPAGPLALSPVILSENSDAVQRFAVNNDMVRDMVNREVLKLTSASDIGTAWKRLGVVPQDVVGIKITTMGGQLLSTHRAIIQAVCDGLQAAGVPPSQIIVWDRLEGDMRRAGFPSSRGNETQVGVTSVFPRTGYDTSSIYRNEIVGNLIWGDSEFIRNDDDVLAAARTAVNNDKTYGDTSQDGGLGSDLLGGPSIPQTSSNSYYATLVTQTCTKIVNIPVLTDNSAVGINGCMASLALGCVDNNRRFQNSPTYGDPAICEILDKDFMRKKVILHILDSLVAQFAGGPTFNPLFTQSPGAIYVSRDPVAIDYLVLKRLEQWRRGSQVDPIGKTASHIATAATFNLGTNDPRRIQLVRVR